MGYSSIHQIQSEVSGKFKWTTASELVFSPSVGFTPATDYSMQLQKIACEKTGNAFEVDAAKIAFHTPYLLMNNANGYWAASANHPGKAALKISMEFNYKVDPVMLSALLKVSIKMHLQFIRWKHQHRRR